MVTRSLRKVYLAFHGLNRSSGNVKSAMGSQVITSAANFITSILLVRGLGLEQFGRFSVAFLLIMVVRNFLNGMVLTPMSVVAPRLRTGSDAAYRGFLLVNAIGFCIGASLLLWSTSVPLGALLNAPWLPEFAIAIAVASATTNFTDFLRRYFFVRSAGATALTVDFLRFTVQLAILATAYVAAPDLLSPTFALWSMTAGSIVAGLVGMLRYGEASWSRRLWKTAWPRHWNFIKWMTPTMALDSVQGQAPMFIGAAILGESALGLVRAIQQVANVLNLPFNALTQIAPSMGATAMKEAGIQGLKKLLLRMTLFSVSVVGAGSLLVLMLYKKILVDLLGITEPGAFGVLLAYMLLNIFMLLRLALIIFTQVKERPAINTAANIVGTSFALIVAPFMIVSFGALAIPSMSVLIVLVTIMILVLLGRRLEL